MYPDDRLVPKPSVLRVRRGSMTLRRRRLKEESWKLKRMVESVTTRLGREEDMRKDEGF